MAVGGGQMPNATPHHPYLVLVRKPAQAITLKLNCYLLPRLASGVFSAIMNRRLKNKQGVNECKRSIKSKP